jgi:hypothetical protein
LLALADASGEQGVRDQVRTAAQTARQGSTEREADLIAYARTRCGLGTARPMGDRPTAVLARARAGEEQDRARLRQVARDEPLVQHLALLDPDLLGLVR